MRKPLASPCALCLVLLLAAASQAQGASKHFRIAFEHFNAYSGKAADLYFKTEHPGEKNILSHLTAISAIYAEKSSSVMHMAEVYEHMVAKRDKNFVLDQLRDIKRAMLASLHQDVKLLADLVETQENAEIRALGNQVVNEMRVFERNTENL
jgi:hypothetical protein